MKTKSKNRFVSWGLFILLSAVFSPLLASGPAQSQPAGTADVYLLGIMDPDDRKHIWALPAEAASGIGRQLAAKYPRKSIDGVIFYRVRSWRDTANVLIEAQAQQGALIVELSNQIKRLKKFGLDRKLTGRVSQIEKRLNKMTDAGYR